jgi:poly-gamma-glutamate synthesis protein (capsule biosynthesis protein)
VADIKTNWRKTMLEFKNGVEIFRESETPESLSIAIAGDCCPWHTAIEPIKAGKSADILKDIKPILDKADLSIVQWETPLTNADTPIDKSGPNLKCPPECVEFIKAAEFDVALLANNHTGDFGPEPVVETIDILNANGIKNVGAGKNLEEACKPLFFSQNGFMIGIVNIAEHEFGTAGKSKPGCAPLEPLDNIKVIKQVAAQSDITLVFIHGGNETNPVPSPRMVRTYRAFAEAGASAVINIHAHCAQGIELWNGVPIVYCPGNFFFPAPWREFETDNFWWTGYLPTITFDKKGAVSIEVTPYTFSPEPWKIEPFTGSKKDRFCKYLAEISAIINDPEELDKYFDGWCAFLGPSNIASVRIFSAYWPVDFSNRGAVKQLLPLRNHFTCEAHNEMKTNYLRMVEEFRVAEGEKYIPKIKKLQKVDF